MSERERPDNSRFFAPAIVPLMRVMYVLQMARFKTWSDAARIKHLQAFADACTEAHLMAHIEIGRLKISNAATFPTDGSRTDEQ